MSVITFVCNILGFSLGCFFFPPPVFSLYNHQVWLCIFYLNLRDCSNVFENLPLSSLEPLPRLRNAVGSLGLARRPR